MTTQRGKRKWIWLVLCERACLRMGDAVVTLLMAAIRPTTARPHRSAALLLLGSLGLLTVAATGLWLPLAAVVALGFLGAIGLLVSGCMGAQLDAQSAAATPPR